MIARLARVTVVVEAHDDIACFHLIAVAGQDLADNAARRDAALSSRSYRPRVTPGAITAPEISVVAAQLPTPPTKSATTTRPTIW